MNPDQQLRLKCLGAAVELSKARGVFGIDCLAPSVLADAGQFYDWVREQERAAKVDKPGATHTYLPSDMAAPNKDPGVVVVILDKEPT